MDRVADSARKVGRSPESITLVAITKYVDVDRMAEAYDLGLRDFGESRVMDAVRKRDELSSLSLKWHFIGHLQTNKVKRVVGDFLIHSVDSWKLAEALHREATARDLVQPILVQVNTSGEPSKYGFSPDETPTMVARIVRELPSLSLCGLMTMAPRSEDPEAVRPFFRRLRELRDAIGPPLEHLSMGMSQDFPIAVEEGATLIRIGSALFGSDEQAASDPAEGP